MATPAFEIDTAYTDETSSNWSIENLADNQADFISKQFVKPRRNIVTARRAMIVALANNTVAT